MLQEYCRKYKIYFTKNLIGNKCYKVKLNKYFNLCIQAIRERYKNVYNIMRNTSCLYIFLIPDYITCTPNEIKKGYYIQNIIQNSITQDEYDTSSEDSNSVYKQNKTDTHSINSYDICDTYSTNTNIIELDMNVNVLEYHSLVLNNLDRKEKTIKQICNKLVLALKTDTYSSDHVIDYYKEIEKAHGVCKRNEKLNGTQYNEIQNGTQYNEMKDGTQYNEMKDGTQYNEMKDGTQYNEMKDGTQYNEMKDGTQSNGVKGAIKRHTKRGGVKKRFRMINK